MPNLSLSSYNKVTICKRSKEQDLQAIILTIPIENIYLFCPYSMVKSQNIPIQLIYSYY